MPVKNGEPYLSACLDSIFNQTYQNWELIVTDDHSKDNTWEILSKKSVDPRVKIQKNKGQGIIDALEQGYQRSRGEFITRMDADDLMPPNKLATLITNLINHEVGHVSTGKVKYIASNKVLQDGYKKYETWLNQLCQHDTHWDAIWKECVIPSPNWICYKSDLDKIGGICSGTYPEDYELCFRMYQKGLKPISTNEVTHIWRDHDERTSRHSEHYADNRFLELKIDFFVRLELEKFDELLIWGAGKKGKQVVQLLNQKNVSLRWVCNNKKKVGHFISNHQLIHFDQINSKGKTAVLICTSQSHDEIKNYCKNRGLTPYFLC